MDSVIHERELGADVLDPDEVPIRNRKVVTQPYDLSIDSLLNQIHGGTIYLRPLSDRPRFQRRVVWNNQLASRLIESILLRVPIPPCYLSQNDDYELDVIDGQQRLYSLFRFCDNQFELSKLEVLGELNGKRFHELDSNVQRQINTHTLRCILITNESHPEVKFEVFERLNTNTVPLNAQELRNCVYRGPLIDMLGKAVEFKPWLGILGRRIPDNRMRDEELVLRFVAFRVAGLSTYRTPQKHWLNDVAKSGRKFDESYIRELLDVWTRSIAISLSWFAPHECFRSSLDMPPKAINRAVFDLTMHTAAAVVTREWDRSVPDIRRCLQLLLEEPEFQDLIARSVDHSKRTKRRFEMWEAALQRET